MSGCTKLWINYEMTKYLFDYPVNINSHDIHHVKLKRGTKIGDQNIFLHTKASVNTIAEYFTYL